MSLVSRIASAAKFEWLNSKSGIISRAATLPEPDFASMPDAEIELWTRRYTLIETARRLRDDNEKSDLRKSYASRIFYLTVAWLIMVVLLVTATGITLPERDGFWDGFYHVQFHLPESVLIAFIGTTTINVIALLLAVTAWLFPKEPEVHAETRR